MELLVVVAVLGILLVMAWPELDREMQRARIQQAVSQTVSLFNSVRMRAIRNNDDYVVTLDDTEHEIIGATAGFGAATEDRAVIDLEALGLRFFPPGFPNQPPELQPAACAAPPADFSFSSTGNVDAVPVRFCVTDHLGNVMQLAIESPVGQTRVYKFITDNDPHGRYTGDIPGFHLETDGGQEWRWY